MEMTINILELIGTFFLGIEAIKLKNFENFLLYLKNNNSFLNQKIHWVEENDNKTLNKKKKTNYNFELLLIGLFFFSGIIYFGFLFFFKIDILNFIHTERNNWFYLPKVILGALIGPILWTISIYLFELLIFLLNGLEKNTKTGVIGIFGILLFILTFILKSIVIE
jgi:hypothetical protein